MKPLIRKSWYTLSEAADYLTKASEGEPVIISDILQLAVEGEISLSIHFFTEVHAQVGRIKLSPERAIAHLPSEDSECYLLPPASIPTDAEMGSSLGCDIDDWYWFLEEDFEVTASPGEFWQLTAHGWGQELEAELWRLSFNASPSALNKPKLVVEPRYKETETNTRLSLIFNPFMVEPSRELFLLPYPKEEEDDPWVISIRWEDIPEDTLIGVTREDLENLLTDDKPEAKIEQADPLETLPADFRALYDAMAAGELPHMDWSIKTWRTYWKGRTPNDGKPYPINLEIIDWIRSVMDNPGQNASKAKAIASIIRPVWAPNHRQAKQDS